MKGLGCVTERLERVIERKYGIYREEEETDGNGLTEGERERERVRGRLIEKGRERRKSWP